MTNEFICKEAIGTLFGYGHIALKALVSHAKNHTLPMDESTRRVVHSLLRFKKIYYLHLHTF